MKNVFDIAYTSTGLEGNRLRIPAITGKKILLLTRETQPQYEVSSFDLNNSSQFLWENSDAPLQDIVLGLDVNPDGGERFLILYRAY